MLKPLSPRTFVTSLLHILQGRPNVPPSLEDNPLLEILLQRRTVRSFTDDPIADDVFAAILEAGRLAPSTVNLQTWSFATFTPSQWSSTFRRPLPFKGAAAVIILTDTHRAKSVLDVFPESPLVEYTIGVMNASLAAMAMNIAAEALGVGSVMLSETGRSGFLDAGYLADVLCLPKGVIPIMSIVFGYPKGGRPPMPPKLPMQTVAFTGQYQEADHGVMQDWLNQMMAGYQASHLGTSFQSQLGIYQSKIGRAEADLDDMVYHRSQS
jgi:FMN reductase (NADPH)